MRLLGGARASMEFKAKVEAQNSKIKREYTIKASNACTNTILALQ